MSQASVLSLAMQIANSQQQSPQTENYYTDAMADLAKQAIFNTVSIIGTTAGIAEYALPATTSKILGVLYDDVMLSEVHLRELEAVDPQWRDTHGRPRAWTQDEVSKLSLRLFPIPVTSNPAPVFPNAAPLGIDYPIDCLVVLHSEIRADLPPWMDLPMALGVLSREFARDSPHMDEPFAKACQDAAQLLFAMVA
jgi:hypothetical protein